MSIIFLLIPLSVVVAVGFLAGFIWAVRTGQYEDTCTPSMRLLLEEAPPASGPPVEAGKRAKGQEDNIWLEADKSGVVANGQRENNFRA
jgi:cbb3-type cytochrome oxidase maturation protein